MPQDDNEEVLSWDDIRSDGAEANQDADDTDKGKKKKGKKQPNKGSVFSLTSKEKSLFQSLGIRYDPNGKRI